MVVCSKCNGRGYIILDLDRYDPPEMKEWCEACQGVPSLTTTFLLTDEFAEAACEYCREIGWKEPD